MSRLLSYYSDYIDKASAHRKRLWIRAAYHTTRALGTPPAWGAGGNDDWKQLPAGIVKGQSTGEYGYDALPLGMPDPPVKGFRIDHVPLFEAGDADLEALSGYMLGGVGEQATFARYTNDPGRLCTTYNLYVLLTDGGDATLDIEDFALEFFGTQHQKLEEPLKTIVLDGVTIEAIQEIETIHIIRTILGDLTPEDVSIHMGNQGYDTVSERYLYDTGYTDSGVWYVRLFGSPPGSTPYQQFVLYRHEDFWTALGWLASAMMETLLGFSDVPWTWETTLGAGGVASVGPYVVTEMNISGLLKTLAHAATEATEDTQIVGFIVLSDDTDTPVGGFFHTGEPTGIMRYDSLWDVLKDATEGTSARARLEQSPIGVTTIIFEPCASRVAFCSPNVPLTAPILRRGLVAQAVADVPGADQEPVSSVVVRQWGTTEDPKRIIPGVFQCSPQLGAIDDVIPLWVASGLSFDNDTVDGEIIGVLSPNVNVNTLWYLSQPSGFARAVPWRVHHYVGVRTSDAATIDHRTLDAVSVDLPTPGAFGGGTAEQLRAHVIDLWWKPFRLAMIEAQVQGGLQYAVCAWVATLYAQWKQYGARLTCEYQRVMLPALGAVADVDAGFTLGTSNAIQAGDPWVVRVTVDDEKATATVDAIGTPTPT